MKKVLSTAILAATIVAAAATANAAVQVNMLGASAQRDYWNSLGQTFMKTAPGADNTGGLGCTAAYKAQYSADFFVVKGVGCSAVGGDGVAYITYGSIASLEGPRAVKEVEPLDDKNSCAANNGNAYRQVVDAANCVYPTNETSVGTCGITCADIHLGTSDTQGESFTQSSTGGINGPGTADFTPVVAPEDTTSLKPYNPTVVPFAFYVNNDLPGLTNLTRTQAVNIFAGNVKNWGQITGNAADNTKGVVVCYRHAGSGTHAALDTAVMRGEGNLQTGEMVNEDPGGSADLYFYQASSGMKTCLSTNGGFGLASDYVAVGYMDADATATNAHQLTYQGAAATSTNIANGVYDFWTKQNVYVDPTNGDDNAMVQRMMDFSSKTVPSSKSLYWATAAAVDAKISKPTDYSLPAYK